MSEERIPWTDEEAIAFIDACQWKDEKGMTWAEVDDHMYTIGFPKRGVQARKDALRRNKVVRKVLHGDEDYQEDQRVKTQVNLVEGLPVTMVQANRPRSAEEMSELFGIDEKLFYQHRIITNQWGNNWQTKVDWRLNEGNVLAHACMMEDLISKLKIASFDAVPPYLPLSDPAPDMMDLIEIVDAHHGMNSWAEETGNNWDSKISLREHRNAWNKFCWNRKGDTVIVRIGDDIFHFDSLIEGKGPATFKGTIQDVDTRWQKMFMEVTEMCVQQVAQAIMLWKHAHIVIVQGNHDWQTSYYLGKLLEARFHNEIELGYVTFDTRPRKRKYKQWGDTLLGFTHKHGKLGVKSLADKIREEAREAWGQTNYVEFHMADEHHEEVLDMTGTGVVVRKLRGLTANDAWHDDEGYSSHRGAQMFHFHKHEGLDSITYYRTSVQAPYLNNREIGADLL